MRTATRLSGAAALACAATLGVAACGSSSSGSSTTSTSASTQEGGTATVLMGTATDYLDPQEGYTTQAAEADWITYTPLLTYKHASGMAGTTLIPGLAKALPTVSSNGKTYTLTLRNGLVYSDGKPVKASDFPYTIERAIKLNWGGKSFFTNYIEGASAYDQGKAKSISGITADDATGKITIHLTTPFGAFANVIAFPSTGLVPTGTAMQNLSTNPPPGVGAYEITAVSPNRTFTRHEPEVRGAQAPRHPGRAPGQGRGQDHVQHAVRGRAGPQQPGRRLRCRRHDPAVAAHADRREGRGSLRAPDDSVDVLLLPQHAREAVQQSARSRGGQRRARPPGDGPPGQRLPDAGVLLPV
jgi:ABC-type transport system substrate-binding protein